jgi:hypothetical protein
MSLVEGHQVTYKDVLPHTVLITALFNSAWGDTKNSLCTILGKSFVCTGFAWFKLHRNIGCVCKVGQLVAVVENRHMDSIIPLHRSFILHDLWTSGIQVSLVQRNFKQTHRAEWHN